MIRERGAAAGEVVDDVAKLEGGAEGEGVGFDGGVGDGGVGVGGAELDEERGGGGAAGWEEDEEGEECGEVDWAYAERGSFALRARKTIRATSGLLLAAPLATIVRAPHAKAVMSRVNARIRGFSGCSGRQFQ